jgi:hypothetical protein
MVAYIFEPILARGEKLGILPSMEKDSSTWFRNQAAKTVVSPQRMIRADVNRFKPYPTLGNMYLFAYDPKHKATLPYYDRFPLVIPFEATKVSGRSGAGGGFYGLNLHYIPPRLRARLMDALYEYTNSDTLDENTKIRISYSILNRVSKLKYFRPCVKQYLFSHLRSKFFHISPTEWNMAIMLPLDRFVGSDKNTVYKESKERIY